MPRPALVHRFFVITAVAKGIDGLLEVIGGLVLLLTTPGQLHGWAGALMQHELSEDPNDRFAHFLLNSTQHLTGSGTQFAALYLLWHGFVKVGLITALLLRIRWAYPAAIVAFVLFLAYQVYRYVQVPSIGLIVLSVLDVIVIGLTYLEYRRMRHAPAR